MPRQVVRVEIGYGAVAPRLFDERREALVLVQRKAVVLHLVADDLLPEAVVHPSGEVRVVAVLAHLYFARRAWLRGSTGRTGRGAHVRRDCCSPCTCTCIQ